MTKHAIALPHAPGEVRYSLSKSAWLMGWTLAWLGGAVYYTTWSAVVVWAASTAVCLCFGHSVGLHRGVIHGAFKMGPWTERILVYLAILCGMDGPLSMVAMHETRDGWQNKRHCPAYYTYDHGLFTDFIWYLHMKHVPRADQWQAEAPLHLRRDRFYRWLERTWRWQQVPVAALLWFLGGWPWVVWGAAGRVSTALVGHWLVNFFAHTHGDRAFTMDAGEEGRNNVWFGFLSMGEGWHNNHHAFPKSAQIGLERHQWDPGWWAIRALANLGLVWGVRRADATTIRPGTVRSYERPHHPTGTADIFW
ncbi:MAG: acyl-CoA desaturase [Myxococcota bacterium]